MILYNVWMFSHPVALDARAELLERRALTSMMQYSKDDGCKAYWMLHSPTMPRWRTTLMAVSRSMWYSSLDKVWLGATTIESPEKDKVALNNITSLWTCIWLMGKWQENNLCTDLVLGAKVIKKSHRSGCITYRIIFPISTRVGLTIRLGG